MLHHNHLAFFLLTCVSSTWIYRIAYGWVLPETTIISRFCSARKRSNLLLLASTTPIISKDETTTNHQDEATPDAIFVGQNDDRDGSSSNKNTVSWSDEEFQNWFYQELVEEAGPILHQTYGDDLLVELSHCVTKWRQRYRMGLYITNKNKNDVTSSEGKGKSTSDGAVVDAGLWKRLFKRDRVVKEIVESIPIIQAIGNYVQSWPSTDGDEGQPPKITILDLCSGKGYLSMILSEYLPAEKVEKLVLIDKAWPMCHAEPKPHHMNWDHIYGNYTTMVAKEDGSSSSESAELPSSYFTTWPIPLHTSKQNLKKSSDMRRLQERLGKGGPCFVLGVHLCGTLSIQAVQLFYSVPTIQGLILKPCCLPGMAYEKRQQTHFQAGRYAFLTKDVCAPGYWKNKEWEGPPRWHLQGKFDVWCRHLHEGMKYVSSDVGVVTKLLQAPVQTSGGFQNTFLFAQKEPTTDRMWDEIENAELKLRHLGE